MADPSAAIAAQQTVQKVLRFGRDHEHGEAKQGQCRSKKVKATASGVAVFVQVKRIEGFKACESACVGRKLQFFGGVHAAS